jgi:hypothetical protein
MKKRIIIGGTIEEAGDQMIAVAQAIEHGLDIEPEDIVVAPTLEAAYALIEADCRRRGMADEDIAGELAEWVAEDSV